MYCPTGVNKRKPTPQSQATNNGTLSGPHRNGEKTQKRGVGRGLDKSSFDDILYRNENQSTPCSIKYCRPT